MLHYMRTTKRDQEHRLWYGVAAMQDDRVEQRVDELTTDNQCIYRLVQRLNEGHASLVHFREIVEDFTMRPV